MGKDKKLKLTQKTPPKSEYFSWINNTMEGSTEAHTLINLNFFNYLNKKYGLKLGVSTGATYVIAKKASLVYPKKKIVFISADGADRYASLNLYD